MWRHTATYWVLVAGVISSLLQILPTPVAVVLTFVNLIFQLNILHVGVLLLAVTFDAFTGRLPRAWLAAPPLAIAAHLGLFSWQYASTQNALAEAGRLVAARNSGPPFAFDPNLHALVMQPTSMQAVLGQFAIPEIFVRGLRGKLYRQTLKPMSDCQLRPIGSPYDPLADDVDRNNPLLAPFCIRREEAMPAKAIVEIGSVEPSERVGGLEFKLTTYIARLDGVEVARYTDARAWAMANNPLPLNGCAFGDDAAAISCTIEWHREYHYVPEMLWDSEIAARLLSLAPRNDAEIQALTTR